MEPRTRADFQTFSHDPGKTDQSFKESCDINTIIRQNKRGEEITHVAREMREMGDFNPSMDMKTALDQVNAATESFMELPSYIRKEMGNSPVKFLEFIENPENRERAITLGLIEGELETPLVRIENPPETGEKTPQKEGS